MFLFSLDRLSLVFLYELVAPGSSRPRRSTVMTMTLATQSSGDARILCLTTKKACAEPSGVPCDGAHVSCSPRYQKVISAPAGEPKLRPPKRWFAASGCCQRLQASKAAASLWGAASFQRQSSSERKQCSTAQPSKAIRPAAALGLYARAASSAPQHSRFLRADRA